MQHLALRRLGLAMFVVFAMLPVGGAQAATHGYSGSFRGSISFKDDLQPDPSRGDQGLVTTETLSWTVKVIDDYRGVKLVSGRIEQAAQGSITQTCEPVPNDPCTPPAATSCSLHQLTSSPSIRGSYDLVEPQPYRDHRNAVGGGFSIPNLVARDLKGGGGACTTDTGSGATWNTGVCTGVPDTNEFDDVTLGPTLIADSGSAAKSYATDQKQTGNCSGPTETVTRTMEAHVSIGGGHAAPHHAKPERRDAQRKKEKDYALRDLSDALKLTPVPCGGATVGALSAVWGSVVPGVGGAALIPATLLTAYYGNICGYIVTRIIDDTVIVNDPPRSDYEAIAEVAPQRKSPSGSRACRSYRGADHTFCVEIERKLVPYVAAVKHATAVDHAILLTIDRQTGALDAHRKAALAKQNAAGRRLESQYRGALAAEDRDGRALASLISHHGVYARFTASQDETANSAAEHRLAKHRQTTQSALSSLIGPAKLAGIFSPVPLNLLTRLR